MTTVPTLARLTEFVRISTVPSSMIRSPPPKSTSLPAARMKVSALSNISKVRFPPSRSTLTSELTVLSSVSSGMIMTTFPAPVIVPLSLTVFSWLAVSSNEALADTTKETPLRSAPVAKDALSASPSMPFTVIFAPPNFAPLSNITGPFAFTTACSEDVVTDPRSIAKLVSPSMIETVPVPDIATPLTAAASTVSSSLSQTNSVTEDMGIETEEPVEGNKT